MKFREQMSGCERVLAALSGKELDKFPIITPTSIVTIESMTRVGAFFPESHINASKMALLAATGHEILGFDTVAPYFSIVLEAAALGCKVNWGKIDTMPTIKEPLLHDWQDWKLPTNFFASQPIRELLTAIKLLKTRFKERVAVIGKVIGPWTLAYHLWGVQNFLLGLIIEPKVVQSLLKKLLEIPLTLAAAQIEAGADVITWADHATGDLVSAAAYQKFLLPLHMKATEQLTAICPVILHTCGNVVDRINYFAQAGFTAFHFDSRNSIAEILPLAYKITLVGGINNPHILLNGTAAEVKQEVTQLLQNGIKLVSPECAVPILTPNKNLIAITQAVKEYARKVRNEGSETNLRLV